MRTSQFPLNTVKETPSDAEIASHQLMIRAGLIRKLAAGLYTWLPLGLRILRKVEHIVREEMNKSGGLEILMPAIQPSELWIESGRWEKYGPELLRFKDRHQREFCYGPTHEEIITDLARNEIRSYKQLPITYYQIQTKFRDEVRPRFGAMRAREFIMKDAYSFHANHESLQETYDEMYDTYCRIFDRCGLNYRAVAADSGSIGGNASHEFHVLADSGEDAIAFSTDSDFAANQELAEALSLIASRADATQDLSKVATPTQRTIDEVSQFLDITTQQCVKTLIVNGKMEGSLIALVVRGDHELNDIKAEKLEQVASPLTLADEKLIQQQIGCSTGFIGPVGLSIPIIVDRTAANMSDFVCGANENGQHLQGVNWLRDLEEATVTDLRNVQEGDPCPDGKGTITLARGIEVGHIFQLGETYSQAMKATVQGDNGRSQVMTMGCYGIGVSRVVAAAIEQHHDKNGIIWPTHLAPFQVALLPMKMHKSHRVKEAIEKLYTQLTELGFDVLLDDRNVRPGFMFSDMELIGIPHRVVLGEKGLDQGKIEYRARTDSENTMIDMDQLIPFLQEKLS